MRKSQATGMVNDFSGVFIRLRPLLARFEPRLKILTDTPAGYVLLTRTPSPFPQHKGEGLYFGAVRLGKTYVSYYLMPLYIFPELNSQVSARLKKRMQGKACFNFKSGPEPELLEDLALVTAAGFDAFAAKGWI